MGRGGSSAEFWRWKYFANPAGPACLVVACEGPRIVGKLGFLPVRMRFGGQEVLAAQQVDVEILPEHRRGGLYFQLAEKIGAEAERRALAFGLGFATDETKELSTGFLGFSLVGPVGRMVKVLSYSHYVKKALRRPAAGASGVVAARPRRAVRVVNGSFDPPVTAVGRFDQRFDRLSERLRLGSIMTIRDSAYLNWRYADCPVVAYRCLAVEDAGGLRGYVVFHHSDSDGARRGMLDELVCDPKDEKAAASLLAAAAAELRAEGAVGATCWLPGSHPLAARLRAGGFRSRAARTSLIVIARDRAGFDPQHLQNEANWYYMLGDSDYHLQAGG